MNHYPKNDSGQTRRVAELLLSALIGYPASVAVYDVCVYVVMQNLQPCDFDNVNGRNAFKAIVEVLRQIDLPIIEIDKTAWQPVMQCAIDMLLDVDR